MPKINVYLPEALAAAVKENGIPVSAVCQQALEQAVRAAMSLHGEPVATPGAPGATRSGLSGRMTRRAREALAAASRFAARRGAPPVAADVLLGVLDEGQNLAVTVLRSLDVEPGDLSGELTALLSREVPAPAAEGPRPDTGELANVLDRAAGEALRLGHNYVGCEHLLLGILAGDPDDLAVRTLHGMGVEPVSARRATTSALAGYFYARSNTTLAGLGAGIIAALDDIRARLGRLEAR